MRASRIDINSGDEQGRTALHIAAEESNIEILSLLIEKHADVNCKTNLVQFTPLHLTCQHLTANPEVCFPNVTFFIYEALEWFL